MTPRDIYFNLTLLILALPIGSFMGTLLVEVILPRTRLAQTVEDLFQRSTQIVVGYVIFAAILLAGWAISQVVTARSIFFLDGERKAVRRYSPHRSEEYSVMDVTLNELPEPRRSNLEWLEDEIGDLLDK
jgi:hypothetical protein